MHATSVAKYSLVCKKVAELNEFFWSPGNFASLESLCDVLATSFFSDVNSQ